jgi:CRISPR-associated protein Cas6
MIDLSFQITGTEIPADHGYALFAAISRLVPAVHGDEGIGVHPISGRLVGNRRMSLTERSRLTIRVDTTRVAELLPLAGQSLDLNGARIRVGVPHTHSLVPAARLYSRLVVIKGFLEPDGFLEAACRQLHELEVHGEASLVPQPEAVVANTASSGSRSPFIRRTLRIRDKEIVGFALRVQGLTAEESIRLQEHGLGGRRRFGCGLFMPDRREVP